MQETISFFNGAIAACGAVTFTNPFEVVKTRLQLQGELDSTLKYSSNPLKSAIKVFKSDGIKGLQKGLVPAYYYQILLNGTRLGLYSPLKDSIHNNFGGPIMFSMVTSGAISGCLGAFFASPFFLIKTQMQSYSPTGGVGFQHPEITKGAFNALFNIYRKDGIPGLWRTAIGSAVQLSTYDSTKILLQKYIKDGILLHFSSSLVTSLFVCVAMNPMDVISTRVYNQKVNSDGSAVYKNALDCLKKTVKKEGYSALFKGLYSHYFRVGPHTVLTFLFLEQMRSLTGFK